VPSQTGTRKYDLQEGKKKEKENGKRERKREREGDSSLMRAERRERGQRRVPTFLRAKNVKIRCSALTLQRRLMQGGKENTVKRGSPLVYGGVRSRR